MALVVWSELCLAKRMVIKKVTKKPSQIFTIPRHISIPSPFSFTYAMPFLSYSDYSVTTKTLNKLKHLQRNYFQFLVSQFQKIHIKAIKTRIEQCKNIIKHKTT